MIFNQEKLQELKAETSKNVFQKLGIHTGVSSVFGITAAASFVTGNIPLFAIASVGLLTKLPQVVNGLRYVQHESSNVVPEYRLMLKNKYMRPFYEKQFTDLSKDYVENSKSLIEKRFKMEFLTEWLHLHDIQSFELKKSGFFDYSVNLESQLKEAKLDFNSNNDSTHFNAFDMGVIFKGLDDNDNLSLIQKEIYSKDFANEGFVGSYLIKGGSSENLSEFLSLQDYIISNKDKKIIEQFLNTPEKDFIQQYKSSKVGMINIDKTIVTLIETGLNMRNQDGEDIAKLCHSIMTKAEKINKSFVQEHRGNANTPVNLYNGYKTDLLILKDKIAQVYPSEQTSKRKLAV